MRGGRSGKGVAGVLPKVVVKKSGYFLPFVLRIAEVSLLEVGTLITNSLPTFLVGARCHH